MLKPIFVVSTLLMSAAATGCNSANTTAPSKPYTVPTELTLDAHVNRISDGRIVIFGTADLPSGLKMWIEVEGCRLPRCAPKAIASDDNVIVSGGRFASAPLWLEVPNTRFTKTGWPKGVRVDVRDVPFPQGKYQVHFEAYFNRAWQAPEVLSALGGEDGKALKGKILTETDPDVIDSPKIIDYRVTLAFPPISPGATAINLVRSAILTEPDKGRSAGDVQANIDLYMTFPGLKAGAGWIATPKGPSVFAVCYGFVDGRNGSQKAIWMADTSTGRVRYLNEYAKEFSWTPSY